MNTIGPTVKLKEIIFGYIESTKQPEGEFLRLWRMAFKGFKQMGLNTFWQAKEVRLVVNANATVTFPPDYIQWVQVGAGGEGGQVTVLKVNNNLSKFNALSSTRAGDVGSGNGVTVDETNKCLILGADTSLSEVIFKYIGAPEEDDDYEVPVQFEIAIEDWLAWRDIKNLPSQNRVNRGDKQDRALAFKASLRLAKRMYKPFRIQEMEPHLFQPYDVYGNYQAVL